MTTRKTPPIKPIKIKPTKSTKKISPKSTPNDKLIRKIIAKPKATHAKKENQEFHDLALRMPMTPTAIAIHHHKLTPKNTPHNHNKLWFTLGALEILITAGLIVLFSNIGQFANLPDANAAPIDPTESFINNVSADKLIELTNALRQKNGLPILKENNQLTKAAESRSRDLLVNNYFAHSDPDGVPFYMAISSAGYNYIFAGENLAMDYFSSEAIFNAWVASPSHLANLLNPNYEEIGIDVTAGNWNGEGTIMVVQEFGTPSVN